MEDPYSHTAMLCTGSPTGTAGESQALKQLVSTYMLSVHHMAGTIPSTGDRYISEDSWQKFMPTWSLHSSAGTYTKQHSKICVRQRCVLPKKYRRESKCQRGQRRSPWGEDLWRRQGSKSLRYLEETPSTQREQQVQMSWSCLEC